MMATVKETLESHQESTNSTTCREAEVFGLSAMREVPLRYVHTTNCYTGGQINDQSKLKLTMATNRADEIFDLAAEKVLQDLFAGTDCDSMQNLPGMMVDDSTQNFDSRHNGSMMQRLLHLLNVDPGKLNEVAISYIYTGEGRQLQPLTGVNSDGLMIAALIDRAWVRMISDKREFGRLARQAGVAGPTAAVPQTFETLNELRVELQRRNEASNDDQSNESLLDMLLFVKGRNGCMREQVRCTTARNLLQQEADHNVSDHAMTQSHDPPFQPQSEVIQEGVKNVWLYQNRFKTTLRAYVVAWNGSLFLSRYAEGIVHTCRDYDERCLEKATQVGCEGSLLKIPLTQLGRGEVPAQILDGIYRATVLAAPMFQHIAAATRQDSIQAALGLDVMPRNDGSVCFRRYALMGIDCIPQHDVRDPSAVGACQIVECNMYPNLMKSETLKQEIIVPMVASIIQLMLGDMLEDGVDHGPRGSCSCQQGEFLLIQGAHD